MARAAASPDRLATLHGLALGFAASRSNARFMFAESCTGGLASQWVTRIGGSSHWFDGAVVCYSNAVKTHLVSVPPETIAAHGAVSPEVAQALAEGIRRHHARSLAGASNHPPDALYGAAITGIAGPGGATSGKPVGTVWFAWAGPEGVSVERRWFAGDRPAIQAAAAAWACCGLFAAMIRTSKVHRS